MKRNAIARIVLYSLVALVLTAVLAVGMAPDFFLYYLGDHSQPVEAAEGSVSADTTRRIKIEWAGGTVIIRRGTGDDIFFYETVSEGNWCQMNYDWDEYTLSIRYGKGAVSGLGKVPKKDLMIEVPEDWSCEELEINGAGLVVQIENLTVDTLELDGAGFELDFTGSITYLDADSAGAKLALHCLNQPEQLDIDGVGCKLDLNIPQNSGFTLYTNGLGCEVSTELPLTEQDGHKVFGNGKCSIHINGLGCYVTISESAECVHVWDGGQQVTIPGSGDEEMVYTCTLCGETKSEPVKNVNILDMQKVTIISGFMGLAGIRANGTVIVHNHNKNPVPETENWQDIRSLAAGNGHIVGLKADGTVIATGDNTYGQCNVSTWNDVIAIDCGGNFTVGLKADGTVLHTGAAPYGVDEVKSWKDITMVEAAADRVIGLKKDGTVVALGDQNFDVCQVPEENDIIDIYLDHQRAIYLHSDGRVEIKGNRLYVEDQTIPGLLTVESDGIYLAGMKADGSMYFDGYDMDIKTAGQIVAIVDLYLCKLGLRSDGTLVILTQYGGSELTPPSWSGMMIP